ncbi:MAG: Maf family protein [Parcubacteria group bacterium]|jgi:septum formation protein
MKIILGTASKWRQAYFKELGYEYEVKTADIDEKMVRSDDFYKLPILIAKAKAEAILPSINKPSILLTFDEIIVFEGRILEKPKDEKEARDVLCSYADKWVETISAVCAENTKSGKKAEGIEVAKLLFKKIPASVIDKFLKKGDILKCAGSFELEDPLLQKYVKKIEGTIDSIAGLPKDLTKELIEVVSE